MEKEAKIIEAERKKALEDIAKIKKNIKIAKISFITMNLLAAVTFGIVYYLIKNVMFLILALFMVLISFVLVKVINRFEKKILTFEQNNDTGAISS